MQKLRSLTPIYEKFLTRFSGARARSGSEDDLQFLQNRLGPLHAKLRLGIEADHEAQVFGQGINYFHIENLRSSHFVDPNLSEIDRIILARLQECSAKSKFAITT